MHSSPTLKLLHGFTKSCRWNYRLSRLKNGHFSTSMTWQTRYLLITATSKISVTAPSIRHALVNRRIDFQSSLFVGHNFDFSGAYEKAA